MIKLFPQPKGVSTLRHQGKGFAIVPLKKGGKVGGKRRGGGKPQTSNLGGAENPIQSRTQRQQGERESTEKKHGGKANWKGQRKGRAVV